MVVDNRMNATVEAKPIGTRGSLGTPLAPCSGIRWHVFHSRPCYERHADLALRRLGMETYLPLMIERWHGADRHIVAVFPRYTFARFDVNAVEWGRDAVSRQGCGEVGKFLLSPSSRMPAAIPDDAIEALQLRCSPDGVIHPVEPRQMRRGDKGKVMSGPFAGFADVCSRTSKDRVWLLLTIMGRQTEVPFKRGDVELVA